MNKNLTLKLLFTLSLTFLAVSCTTTQNELAQTEDVPVIPYPYKILKRTGYINLDHNFWVVTDVSDSTTARLGKYLVEEIDKIPGAIASIADLYSTRSLGQSITIELVEDPDLDDQGYTLSITSKNIQIQANSAQGLFYGMQSILEILRSKWDRKSRAAQLRKMVISDHPNTTYRIADPVDAKDSVDYSSLARTLAEGKINFLAVRDQKLSVQDSVILAMHYISTINPDENTHGVELDLTGQTTSMEKLFLDKSLSGSDTVVVQFNLSDIENLRPQILIGSQLTWSGAERKSYDWLIQLIQNKNTSNL